MTLQPFIRYAMKVGYICCFATNHLAKKAHHNNTLPMINGVLIEVLNHRSV